MEYTPQQLSKLPLGRLIEIAKERRIPNYYSLTKRELLLALGSAPKEAEVHDRAAGLSYDEIRDLREKNMQIPSKTVYWKKDRQILEEIWAKNPFAFNGVDLTDRTTKVQHVFNKKVKCICGEKFKIQREYYVTKRNKQGREVEQLVIDPNPTEIRNCPGCDRKYIYHDPKIEQEVAV